jgi:hypothetical protein
MSQIVIPRRKWRGIQSVLIFRYFSGFRVSPTICWLARNDSFDECDRVYSAVNFEIGTVWR